MTTRVAILDDYQNIAFQAADWSSLPSDVELTVFNEHIKGEQAVVDALADFDVVVAMRERTPFPATLIEKLPKLKLLVTTGMRNFAIDMEAARKRGLPVCGTALLPYPAFEHAWALILALFKQIPREDRAMHEGGWQSGLAEGLRGKTLGIVGLGKLGSQVARVGVAFDMKVIAWSQNLSDKRTKECGAVKVDKDKLFAESDVVTIHLVLSDRTRGLVGRRELGLMKPSAYLVNTSRGPIVEEAALIEVLQKRAIAAAGIDVYDVEPLPRDHPLRKLDNAILTGHTAYVIRETYELAYGEAVENIRAWLEGKPIRLLNA
ncbi:MAG: D-2-hydroxyacid dehydrogenase family protein [Proteobacteria bacterium]|nr:MAG: D-2-hydroxyacid dehydrogenase family protein [Pseudomonadota bacterium]